MSENARVARNTLYLTIASVIQKIISFGYFFYFSKAIGPDHLGAYAFALSFSSIFIIFMDFGLGPLLTREGARFGENLQYYFENVLNLKIILTVLSLIGMYVTIHIFGFLGKVNAQDIFMVYLAGMVIILDTFTFTFFSVFRALKQIKYEAIALVVYQIIILLSGFLFLRLHFPVHTLILALALGSLFNFIFFIFLVRRKAHLRFRLTFPRDIFKKFLVLSFPFAVAGIFAKLLGTLDSVLLRVLAGERYVGWYALAYKLFFALTILPGSFAISFYPATSYFFKFDREKLKETLHWGLVYMFLLALPITFAVWILADNLILQTVWKTPNNVWGASVPTLHILITSLLFVFVNYPLGNLLNACNRQTVNTVNTGIALIINVIANLLLIPRYTFLGTAVAYTLSSIVLVGLNIPHVVKIVSLDIRFLWQKFFRIFVAASLSTWYMRYLEDYVHFVLVMVAGVFAYIFLLFFLQIIGKKELTLLLRPFRKHHEENTPSHA